MKAHKIGLALSGGGSRAIAFHLGCMRALHDLGILQQVKIISTVSGGSVIGALYASTDEPFEIFEQRIRTLLAQGLTWPTIRTAYTTTEGLKAISCAFGVALANCTFGLVTTAFKITRPWRTSRDAWKSDNWHLPIRRVASRTTMFRRALDDVLFKGSRLSSLKASKPLLVINAAELRTGAAFYFTSQESGCWRYGRLADPDLPLAHAVTASAAYPMFLPALDEEFAFEGRDGIRRVERVVLCDGGVYDNLGLAPLWPDRHPSASLKFGEINTIICCRAGYSLRHDPPTHFLVSRLKSAIACIHDRAQNSTMKRLFDLQEAGKLKAVVVASIGQNDAKLTKISVDCVRREEVHAYPTDFSAMSPAWMDRLISRGEQVMRAIVQQRFPSVT